MMASGLAVLIIMVFGLVAVSVLVYRASERRLDRPSTEVPESGQRTPPSTADTNPERAPSAAQGPALQPAPQANLLAIDFGTYNTVATLRRAGGHPATVLLFDGSPLLASNVYADESGELFTGRDAAHLARLDPARYEPNPKRRIDDRSLLLGETEYDVVDVIAAVLRRVVEEAYRSAGAVADVVLTHPAAWGPRRQATLRAAANRAGIPAVRMLAEPVAAAHQYIELADARWHDGQTLVVFDFGAGTLDVAAIRRRGTGFEVIGYDGLDGLGGLDIDAAIIDHIGTQVAQHDIEVWRRLMTPSTIEDQRAQRLLWQDARSAKEMLSRTSLAPLPITGYPQGAHLTRDELNRLATPLVERAVHTMVGVLNATGTPTSQLAGIFLVGGSSRLPLVAHTILARLRIAATVSQQPETVVSTGATLQIGNTDGHRAPAR